MLRRYLSREIGHWTQAGLLNPSQGETLLADYDRRHTGFSLSSVLAVLAAVLFGAAVIALIAANWEYIARPVRVVMIFLLIISGLSAAGMAAQRNANWICEAALVFTLLCFGAGIALVGQMYHLSGDEAAFMLTWTVGAMVVSLAFSSGISAISAGLLGIGYLFAVSNWLGVWRSDSVIDLDSFGLAFAVALALAVSAWRSRSTVAGHLCALMLIGWVMWGVDNASELNPGYVLTMIGTVAFAVGSLVPASLTGGQVSRHGVVSTYGAVLLLSGLAIIQADSDISGLVGEMAFAAFILVASVVVLVVAGRDNQVIRRFAYFAFACETVYVVGETLGSLLGSAGFLFIGGLVLAVVAFAVMKIEKRFNTGEGRS